MEEQQAQACFRMTKDSPLGPGESGKEVVKRLSSPAQQWSDCVVAVRGGGKDTVVMSCSEGLPFSLCGLCQLHTEAHRLIGLHRRS